jgi:uncharacterized HAD superfamily protein
MKKIAVDIDSTLHNYWDLFARVVRDRCGVELSYSEQSTWHITQLDRSELIECVSETHSDDNILSARPYDGAVEAVANWHQAGHFIHITSHRNQDAWAATKLWLDQVGLAYDDLYCSFDKVARCEELGIDLLIDDSPVNIERASGAGIATATIAHPWNATACAANGTISGTDWHELAHRLKPLLA